MPRHTTRSAIRKYKLEYYRLMAYEARLNEQAHHMKKRIRNLAEDEQTALAQQMHLGTLLAKLQLQKAELEQAVPSREQSKILKKVEKEFKEVNVKYKRNEHRLAVIENKKEKDNVTKLVLKEAKRDEVSARAQAAYETWKKFEQIEQWKNIDFKAFKEIQEATTEIITKVRELTVESQRDMYTSAMTSTHVSPRLVLVASATRFQQRIILPRFCMASKADQKKRVLTKKTQPFLHSSMANNSSNPLKESIL